MNRLTKRAKDGLAYSDIPLNQSSVLDVNENVVECYTGFIAERLADYEDAGLDPKQFKKVYDLCINNTEHFNERVIQLRRYKDLEEQLLNKYNELQSKFSGDGIKTYTTGYRAGPKKGQIELLEWILNIDTGCRQEAEKALEEF